jgi:hypothetical protein
VNLLPHFTSEQHKNTKTRRHRTSQSRTGIVEALSEHVLISKYMDRLPAELVDRVFGFLCTQSSKNLRLSCKSFAEIGESHLFNAFEFRLYPQLSRLKQLKQLSVHPTIAPKLRCLCYESAVSSESGHGSDWVTRISSSFKSPSRGVSSDGKEQKAHQQSNELLEGGFSPEQGEPYQRWLDHQAGLMAHSPEVAFTFASMLNHCCSLKSIKLVLAKPDVNAKDLMAHGARRHEHTAMNNLQLAIRIDRERRNCLAHFMSLLKAVYSSGRIVSELIAIDLPKAMLQGGKYEADIIARVFASLEHLDLKIDDFPHSNLLPRSSHVSYFRGRDAAATTLRKLLNEPKELRRLSLTIPLDRVAEFSYDIFDQVNLDRCPRKWLHGLKQLSLSNFLVPLAGLLGLLDEARDLKSLALRQADLKSGSMIGLLAYLRHLKLDDVFIGGEWVIKEDGGEWHCHGDVQSYNCCGYEGRSAVKGLWSKIESYMIDGGPCPLREYGPQVEQMKTWELEGDSTWHFLPG